MRIIVHHFNPAKLICHLQRFGDTFFSCHLWEYRIQQLVCLSHLLDADHHSALVFANTVSMLSKNSVGTIY